MGTCAGTACVPTLEAALNGVLAAVGTTVNTVLGCPDRKCEHANTSAAEAAAQDADVVILALGLDGSLEGEGSDRMDIRLPGQQLQLAQAVVSANKPVVLLLFNGGTISIEELKGLSNVAIVECFYPGATGWSAGEGGGGGGGEKKKKKKGGGEGGGGGDIFF